MYLVINAFLIAAIGGVTCCTDLLHRKIRNWHLVCFFAATMICHIVFWREIDWRSQAVSLLLAVCLSGVMYFNQLWQAGDLKLFLIYALVMPPTRYDALFLAPCMVMFLGAFLIALSVMLPFLIWAGVRNREHWTVKGVFSYFQAQKLSLLWGFMPLSWFFMPLIDRTVGANGSVLIKSLIMMLIYLGIKGVLQKLMKSYALKFVVTIAGGVILRVWLAPSLLTFSSIFMQAERMCLYGLTFYLFLSSEAVVKELKDRVPFAFFLLGGCLLSYTDVLGQIMALLHWRP